MKELISAVVIDDNQDDVKAVTDALGKEGIPTYPIHYTGANEAFEFCDGIAASQPRVIITDIQINSSVGDAPTTTDYSNIATCIQRLVENTRGPYMVLAWTDKKDHLNELKEYITGYFDRQNIHQPFYFDSICKEQCKEEELVSQYSTAKIFEKVVGHLDKNKEVRALMCWEKQVLRSAHGTVNTLIEIAKGELGGVLASLGKEAAGHHFQGNESIAINESLIYILRDELSKNSVKLENKNLWAGALAGHPDSTVDNQKFNLNTILHLDQIEEGGINCPGDVWMVNGERIFGTFGKKEDIDEQVKIFKADLFVPSEKGINWRKEIAKISDPDRKREKKLLYNEKVTEKISKGKQNSKYIAIEISSKCDFFSKGKYFRNLVLGLLVPSEYIDDYVIIKRSNSILCLPVTHNDESFHLVISAKYVVTFSDWLIDHDDFQMNKIFRIRESLLQSWIQSISAYNARIGTISFR